MKNETKALRLKEIEDLLIRANAILGHVYSEGLKAKGVKA